MSLSTAWCVAAALTTLSNSLPRKVGSAAIGFFLIAAIAVASFGYTPNAYAAATASDLAEAMGLSPGDIVSADLGGSDQEGVGILGVDVLTFPREGDDFAVLSSGCAEEALADNDFGNRTCELDGIFTSQDTDLVQLNLTLNVPEGANSFSFDWIFFSEEWPEFVGDEFNDHFLVEIGESNFVIEDDGVTVTAPNNIAFDENGDLISINTSGALGMRGHDPDNPCEDNTDILDPDCDDPARVEGTTYDGATQVLTTIAPIPEDSDTIVIIFSVLDIGDSAYDSTVFLDNFEFFTGGDEEPTTKLASDLECDVPSTAEEDNTINVSATLTDSSTSDPIVGAIIHWMVLPDGPTDSSITDGTGEATASLDLTGLPPGNYDVVASFAGNDTYQQASCKAELEITSAPEGPNYDLNLLEGPAPSDLVYNLGQEATAVAETDDTAVTQVEFKWINPSATVVDTEIVPLTLGSAESMFTPDQVGTWIVVADFGNGEVIVQTLDIHFLVIPESPIGIAAIVGSSLAALGAFMFLKNKTRSNGTKGMKGLGI